MIERGISNALIEGIKGRICRLREQNGIMFGPHTFRHTWAPELLRRGVAVEVASPVVGSRVDRAHRFAFAHLSPRQAVVQQGSRPGVDVALGRR